MKNGRGVANELRQCTARNVIKLTRVDENVLMRIPSTNYYIPFDLDASGKFLWDLFSDPCPTAALLCCAAKDTSSDVQTMHHLMRAKKESIQRDLCRSLLQLPLERNI